ncbi:hypothetical protein [Nocardia wallacei]|uniref:hypothetical protein n=1 Tax=Nocardia wallacei TaxID=480035 RepID=UPI002455E664|nr:hypothetical protein [Nocardia wallacei]
MSQDPDRLRRMEFAADDVIREEFEGIAAGFGVRRDRSRIVRAAVTMWRTCSGIRRML